MTAYVRGRLVAGESPEAIRELRRTTRCDHCGLAPTPEGHDGCLGALPGVRAACCGHGVPANAYIFFNNGTAIYEFTRVRQAGYIPIGVIL